MNSAIGRVQFRAKGVFFHLGFQGLLSIITSCLRLFKGLVTSHAFNWEVAHGLLPVFTAGDFGLKLSHPSVPRGKAAQSGFQGLGFLHFLYELEYGCRCSSVMENQRA